MLNDVEARDASIEPGTENASETPSLSGTVEEVRGLKRWVELSVYGPILVLIPLYTFVFQMATIQAGIILVVSFVMAAEEPQTSGGGDVGGRPASALGAELRARRRLRHG